MRNMKTIDLESTARNYWGMVVPVVRSMIVQTTERAAHFSYLGMDGRQTAATPQMQRSGSGLLKDQYAQGMKAQAPLQIDTRSAETYDLARIWGNRRSR
jgi:hypothetical protein